MNNYINDLGTNPYAGGKTKKKYLEIAMKAIRDDLGDYKAKKPVILHYIFYEPSKGMKRDYMNVFSFADKIIEDALVKFGTISDDSPKYVINATHEFRYTDDVPFIVVRIEETD